MLSKEKSKKGQISLADAPQVVFIVGFIFLLMATIAYVAETYNENLPDVSKTVLNESRSATTFYYLNGTNMTVRTVSACNFGDFVITGLTNVSSGTNIGLGNVTTYTNEGVFINASSDWTGTFPITINYTYTHGGTACNVTDSLQEELDDNTSIAGIVLTISLVGIVLSVLIGIFVATRRRTF